MAKAYFNIGAIGVGAIGRSGNLPGGESYEIIVEGVAHWHSDPSWTSSEQQMMEVFLAKVFLDVDDAGKITMNGGFKVFKSGQKTQYQNFSSAYYPPDHYNVTIKGKFSGGKTASLVVSYDAKTRKSRSHEPYRNSDSIKFKGIPVEKEKKEEKKETKPPPKPKKIRVLKVDVGTFSYGEAKFSTKVKGKSSNHYGYSEFKKAILAGADDLRMDMRTGVLASKHKIVITGYADYTGPEPENDRLAKRRALAVQKMMIDVLGVTKDRFSGVAGRQITKKKVVKGDPGNPASRYVTVVLPWQYV